MASADLQAAGLTQRLLEVVAAFPLPAEIFNVINLSGTVHSYASSDGLQQVLGMISESQGTHEVQTWMSI